MRFKNRSDAGKQLAAKLIMFADEKDVLVLGIPRGGVPVAYEIATALHVPLDIFLSRKLGVPANPELAFGAVAADDGRYLDKQIIAAMGITQQEVERISAQTRRILDDRAIAYRKGRPRVPVEGKTLILVDDGIATGASMYAAIQALRQMKPKKLIVAVPVAPRETCARLDPEVDSLIVLQVPVDFYAVGQFYEDFRETSDQQVIDLLGQANRVSQSSSLQAEIGIPIRENELHGTLTLPGEAKALVLFAHGSGSGRYSPRNRFVAEELQKCHLGTLLFDLLTQEEEYIDNRTAALRFDISLLANRLIAATDWVISKPETKSLPICYFGASTGAAAALVAAARKAGVVRAVVSRGGRPDLAETALSQVQADTLLIVGGLDDTVIQLNKQALRKLTCEHKQLVIIPQATHLFEEPGALERVAQLAGDWFLQSLSASSASNVYQVVAR